MAGTETFKPSSKRSRGRNFLGQDRDLKGVIEGLKTSRTELETLDEYLKEYVGVDDNSAQGFIAKITQAIVPRVAYPLLPQSLVRWVGEEEDVLEKIEGAWRSNNNSMQVGLKNLGRVTREKIEEINNLKETIEKAEAESWDAKQLQEYMNDKAGIELFDEVAELLDAELGILTDEVREKRKTEILADIKSSLSGSQDVLGVMRAVLLADLKMFQYANVQFYHFMNILKPLKTMRDAAKDAVEIDVMIFAARGALEETIKRTIEGIGTALEVVKAGDNYSIASASMQKLLSDGKEYLEGKLADLDKSSAGGNRKFISSSAGGVKTAVDLEPKRNEGEGESTFQMAQPS